MYLVSFLRSVIPMLVCIVGLYLFTVRREHCQMKFNLCIIAVLVFQYVIFYFMFNGDPEIQGMPISKILQLLMISFLTFWGGLYVYGGWSRIGIYIFSTDIVLGIGERIYWVAWEHLNQRLVERSIVYYKGNRVVERDSFPMFLFDCLLLVPFLVGGYKLRSRPLRPERLMKVVVIIYLILGASPLIARLGFERESAEKTVFTLIVWSILCFLVIMTIHITTVRENRQILYLRKQVVAEQSRLLMIQKEKVRRLRHDVKKHLGNLEYILEKEPDLRSDPSLVRYQEKLNAYEAWMKGFFYCDSSVMNLCFEQIKRYCDDREIVFEITLKRLDFSGWTQEDQLTFGTLIFNLIQLYGDSQSITAIRYTGDCMLGQNILRITMESGNDGVQVQNKMKLISNLEKDIRLILSKYEGKVERADDEEMLDYVLNWKDESGKKKL